MRSTVRVLAFVAIIVCLTVPALASAAGLFPTLVPQCGVPDAKGNIATPCQLCHLVQLGNNFIRLAVSLSVIVATLMFTYAGIMYVTAAANPEQIKKASKIFSSVFLGLVVILVAWLIVDVIMRTLLRSENRAPWSEIRCIDQPAIAEGGFQVGNVGVAPDVTGSVNTCANCAAIETDGFASVCPTCTANTAFRTDLDEFATALGERADETAITEAGPNTTVAHQASDRYARGATADIACRGASRVGGVCTVDWVVRNGTAWTGAGGWYQYETSNTTTRDRLNERGIPSCSGAVARNCVLVLPLCGTGRTTGCITGPHMSIYND